jgi:Cu(I)/Ag(I) efflux system protein CusF
MKYMNTVALLAALTLAAGGALAQQMQGMKDMPMAGAAQGQAHHASGTVKKVDAAKGMVTLAHGPVASLDWPAMTMGFKVRDKALFDQLAVGRTVEFDFVKDGAGFTVTAVR